MNPPAVLLEALASSNAASALRLLDLAGKLTDLLPELEAGRAFQQPELHYYDVLDHNLAAVAAVDVALGDGPDGQELREAVSWIEFDESLLPEIEGLPLRILLRLACLVHDIAKPATAIVAEGRLRFPRHGARGAEMLRERLPSLGFGPAATDFVAKLVRYHLRPGELVKAWPASDRAVRRFVADIDGHVLPIMLLNLADGMATRGPRYTRDNFRRHLSFVNYVAARAWAVSETQEPPLISGDDLIAGLDLSGGRLLGAVLTSVRRAQAEGVVSSRDDALAFARSTFATLTAEGGEGGRQE
jgi:hypothetical protein